MVREIQALVDRGLDYIFFVDNNFNFPEEQAEGICREIVRQKVPVRWTAYVNPGFLNDRLGEAMKASGCAALEFGLDAAAPAQLDALGKNFSLLQIREAARICRERDIPFCFSLLLGGPGETRATLEETLSQVEDLNPTAVICMTGIRVFPGTRLAEIAREEGLLPARLESPGAVFLSVPEGPGSSGSATAGLFGGPSELDLPGLGDRPASRRGRQDASVGIERSVMGVLAAQEKKERRS